MSATVLILNGPNLNMLGKREVHIYGTETLSAIEKRARTAAAEKGFDLDFRQSNSEGELVDWIQQARGTVDGLIINGGAYTHTSVAILDALSMLDCPVIELHLSNIFRREEFRKDSFISLAADGIIAGFGADGYILALDAISNIMGNDKEHHGQGNR